MYEIYEMDVFELMIVLVMSCLIFMDFVGYVLFEVELWIYWFFYFFVDYGNFCLDSFWLNVFDVNKNNI